MKGTSLLWVGPARIQGAEARLRDLRAAGLFPVAVQSVEGALHLLTQFRVGTVVLHTADGQGWQDCARVLATGSRVAVVIDVMRPESTERYLSAGCAAVIAASCTSDELTAALSQVAAGQRDIVCAESSPVDSTPTHRTNAAVARDFMPHASSNDAS